MSDETRAPPRRENVPGEPHMDPEITVDGYDLYPYGRTGGLPEELYVRDADPDDYHSEMWTFAGNNGIMVGTGYVRHRYGPGRRPPDDPDERKPCCLMRDPDHGLRADDFPEDVIEVVQRATDAPVATRDFDGSGGDDA